MNGKALALEPEKSSALRSSNTDFSGSVSGYPRFLNCPIHIDPGKLKTRNSQNGSQNRNLNPGASALWCTSMCADCLLAPH
jgi:hypothetical protein